MVAAFYKKYFFVSEQITFLDLGKMFQRNNEHPNDYVKRFRIQALNCHNPNVTEQQLVESCINGMVPIYRALLENLRFQTFSELHEAAKRSTTTTPALLERTRPTKSEEAHETRGNRRLVNKQYNTGPSVSVVGEGGRRKAPAAKQPPKRAAPAHQAAPPRKAATKAPVQPQEAGEAALDFPFPIDEVIELLEAWIQDDAIKLPPIRRPPTEEEMENPKYCRYHRFVHHPTNECYRFKHIFKEKVEAGELQLGNEGVHRDPLPVRSCMLSGDSVHKKVQSMMQHVCEILYFSKAQSQDIFTALNRVVSGRRLFSVKETAPKSQPLSGNTVGKCNWGLLTTAHLKDVEFDSSLIDAASDFNIFTVKTLRSAGFQSKRLLTPQLWSKTRKEKQ